MHAIERRCGAARTLLFMGMLVFASCGDSQHGGPMLVTLPAAGGARCGSIPGLIHWWPGDGNAEDVIGGSHGAMLNGATFDVGVTGQAFSFDGVDDYMEVPADSIIPTAGEFTVTLWVDQLPQAGFVEYVSQGFYSASTPPSFYVGTSRDPANQYRLGDTWITTGITSLEGTGWHHLAVSRTSTNTYFYIDGTLRLDYGSAIPNPPDAPFRLGRQFGRFQEYLHGRLDDVRIYDRGLSEAEIQGIFRSRSVVLDIKPGSCQNPFNPRSRGLLPVAILGTPDFDVTTVDPDTIRLECVAPVRYAYEHLTAPPYLADCDDEIPDGHLDLTLKFDSQEINVALGDTHAGEELILELTGGIFASLGGGSIEGMDVIVIVGGGQ